MELERDYNAIYFGIGLLVFQLFIAFGLEKVIDTKVEYMFIRYMLIAIYGFLKLGLIFYGQTLIKKLNRQYARWSALLFFFTSITLIILGLISKLERDAFKISYTPEAYNQNVNQLLNIEIETDSSILLESIKNDVFTLNFMLIDYTKYLKENTNKFPLLAAYEINKRGKVFSSEAKLILEEYAKSFGFDNFQSMVKRVAEMTPEDTNNFFNNALNDHLV